MKKIHRHKRRSVGNDDKRETKLHRSEMLWTEAVNMCECVRNIMDNTGSTKSTFKNIYGEKPKIIGSFSEFGRIGYVTK